LSEARRAGCLTWDVFAQGWWRLVRRLVLGDSARDDAHTTDLLASLRRDANWSFLKPRRKSAREEFLRQVGQYVARAEPGSLASLVAEFGGDDRRVCPVEQVPQWLFAFDAAGMASFRTLALLDAHREVAAEVARQISGSEHHEIDRLSLLRACVLESLRLWPTTPAILRDTTRATSWYEGELPAGAAVLIFAPYFHRDDEKLPFADAFSPELWTAEGAKDPWPFMPFSAGPARCPGRELVLFTTSQLLCRLITRVRLTQAGARPLAARGPLPRTLSPFRLRFQIDDH
jgi:hypothetical protein